MLLPQEVYPLVLAWLNALEVGRHRTGRAALAALVTAVLVAQSLRPAALMRALLSPRPVPARQRYKRVARRLTSPWLTPEWLTPVLVRAALSAVEPTPTGPLAGLTHLALDSVRCGRWEVFTLGVVWQGRTLPVGWAVLPYPWPKGQFTPTVCRLIDQVAAVWPAERPVELVADRAFPSYDFFAAVERAPWRTTVRLQARHWVSLDGEARQARELLAGAAEGRWTMRRGAYGSGARAVPGTLVVGRGLVVLPQHQRGDGSLRHRARRLGQRRQHAASKNKRRTAEADAWVILFTPDPPADAAPVPVATGPVWRRSQASYRQRWPIEGTYRDAQTGWDGHHGWDLARQVARCADADAVARLVGLWALATLVQTWLGAQVAAPEAPAAVRQVAAQWTTTGRLSLWARGRFALTEPSGWLRPWVRATLAAGARRLAAPPPQTPGQLVPPPAPPSVPVRPVAA